MSQAIISKVVTELAILPEEAQNQVLAFVETLRDQHSPAMRTIDEPSAYPLRGEVYTYLDPFEPAVTGILGEVEVDAAEEVRP